LSADAIPTREGKAIIPHKNEDIWFLLAYLNISLVRRIVEATSGLHKQSGSIGLLPVPKFSKEVRLSIGLLAKNFAESQLRNLCFDETSRFFQGPKCLLQEADDTVASGPPYQAIDDSIFDGLAIDVELRDSLRCITPEVPPLFSPLADDLVSFAVGCCFGRWSYRPSMAQPYRLLDQIPDRPAAIRKQEEEGTASHDGILVDDSESSSDIVTCTHDAIERLTSSHQADSLVKDMCQSLGISNLREYFRTSTSGGFWQAHLGRYNKSRRQAPIYWLIQSSNRNYALWLYYHRLDKDTLFKALVNYVEPKIRLETDRHETLRNKMGTVGNSGKEAKRLAKNIEGQEDFLSELRDFEDKLRRAATLHLEPDLNDGVDLNIAPLHELVPWNEAEGYWEELLAGKYEWSSISKQLRQKGSVK